MRQYISALALLALAGVVAVQAKSELSSTCVKLYTQVDKCRTNCSEQAQYNCNGKTLEEGDKRYETYKCLQMCGPTPDVDIPYQTCSKKKFSREFGRCTKTAGCDRRLGKYSEYEGCKQEQCTCLYAKLKDEESGCKMEEKEIDKMCLSKEDRKEKKKQQKEDRKKRREQKKQQKKAEREQKKAERQQKKAERQKNGNRRQQKPKTKEEWKARQKKVRERLNERAQQNVKKYSIKRGGRGG